MSSPLISLYIYNHMTLNQHAAGHGHGTLPELWAQAGENGKHQLSHASGVPGREAGPEAVPQRPKELTPNLKEACWPNLGG